MKNKLDERQQLINYKYGYHSYLITAAELAFLLILNVGLEPDSSAIEAALFKLLEPSVMLPLVLIPPFLYFYTRTTFNGGLPEEQRKQNILYYPIAIITFAFLPSNMPTFKYITVILFVVIWIISLFTYLKDKKKQNELEIEE